MDYRFKTTEELVNIYSFENGRANREDAECTKELVKKELRRRFAAFISLLDDEQTTENPEGTFNYLLGK